MSPFRPTPAGGGQVPGLRPDPTPATDGPHRALVGMTLDGARRHLEAHGLKLVVTRRDRADVPDADLTTPGAVLVTVTGDRVTGVDGRT